MAQTNGGQYRCGSSAAINGLSSPAANPAQGQSTIKSNTWSQTSRSRSCSTLSNRQPFNRVPLTYFSEAMKARKVIFYRNGDPYFKGLQFAIRSLAKMEHYQAFEFLLAEVNASALCDPSVLKQGVRYIFTVDGALVTDCDQLLDGHSYVCSSTPVFKALDYENIEHTSWVLSTKKVRSPRDCVLSETAMRQRSSTDMNIAALQEFVPTRAKMIVVIRAGPRPRRIVRKLLNKRTARTFDQVLTVLAKELDIETGLIKRICTLYGRPVVTLEELFLEEQVFVAFGNDKYSGDDLKISDIESKFIDAACGPHLAERSSRSKCVSSDCGQLSDCGHQQDATSSGSGSQVACRYVSDSALKLSPISPSHSPSQSISPRDNSPRDNKPSAVKPKVIKVNRGYSGKDIGIPVRLLNKYKIGRVLFEGDFVTIKRCFDRNDRNKKFALKIVNKLSLNSEQEYLMASELCMMRQLQHNNLLMMVEELDTPSEWYFIMELFQGSDLFDAIVTADKFRYTETDASQLLRQLLLALEYLHSLDVVHRNIKPENILVMNLSDSQKIVKLGDFGLATEVNGFLHDIVGCDLYHSPEMFTSKGYGLKADIWAVGVVSYIVLCGFPPFGSAYSIRDVLSTKVGYKRVVFPSPYWDKISDAAKDLILFMLEGDQFIRGSASDMLEHPWLADPVSTANDIDLHESVASRMKDLMSTSTRFSPPNVGLLAVTSLDKGLGVQNYKNDITLPSSSHDNISPR